VCEALLLDSLASRPHKLNAGGLAIRGNDIAPVRILAPRVLSGKDLAVDRNVDLVKIRNLGGVWREGELAGSV